MTGRSTSRSRPGGDGIKNRKGGAKIDPNTPSQIVEVGDDVDLDDGYVEDEEDDGDDDTLLKDTDRVKKVPLNKMQTLIDQIPQAQKQKWYEQFDREERQKAARKEPTLIHALIFTIGLCALFAMLEILLYQQYGLDIKPISYRENEQIQSLVHRTAGVFLPFWIIAYVVHKFRYYRAVQVLLFISTALIGYRMLHIFKIKMPNYGDMQQTPGLGALWVYAVCQMDLPYALVSSILLLAYFWSPIP